MNKNELSWAAAFGITAMISMFCGYASFLYMSAMIVGNDFCLFCKQPPILQFDLFEWGMVFMVFVALPLFFLLTAWVIKDIIKKCSLEPNTNGKEEQ